MSDTTAVAAAQAAQGALAGLKKAAAKTKEELPAVTGMHPYLKLEKTGNWVYGPEDIEVQEGSLWAINPLSFKHGWTCWTSYPSDMKKKNENKGKVMVPLGADKPEVENLTQYMDPDGLNNGQPWPWTAAMSVELTCLNGEDEGTVVVYDTNSTGGVRLLSAYFDKMMAHLDTEDPVAIVTLDSDSYKHQTYGKVITPLFEYEDWVGLDEVLDGKAPAIEDKGEPEAEPEVDEVIPDEPDVEDAEVVDEEPPKRTRRRPAAETSEPEGEAPKPTRRRRPAA